MTKGQELAYEDGERMAWRSMLRACLQALGVEDAQAEGARWVLERDETIARLRSLCAEHGDTDWEPDLYIPDILDKHLTNYLEAK